VPDVVTLGHSTRTADEFLRLLHHHGVTALADVRTVPRSRRHPQFAKENLAPTLEANGIAYHHFPGLGGLRRPRKDSPNDAWRNDSFRGYADYMQTPEFAEALDAFLSWAGGYERTALMCAEAVPWRCHRSLVADALLVRGIVAREVIGLKEARPHKLTPFARVDGTRILYPAEAAPDAREGLPGNLLT